MSYIFASVLFISRILQTFDLIVFVVISTFTLPFYILSSWKRLQKCFNKKSNQKYEINHLRFCNISIFYVCFLVNMFIARGQWQKLTSNANLTIDNLNNKETEKKTNNQLNPAEFVQKTKYGKKHGTWISGTSIAVQMLRLCVITVI